MMPTPVLQPTATQLNAFRICAQTSESVHVLAHNASMALYRLQEHVRKSTPAIYAGS
jgi:hypothetical protein